MQAFQPSGGNWDWTATLAQPPNLNPNPNPNPNLSPNLNPNPNPNPRYKRFNQAKDNGIGVRT